MRKKRNLIAYVLFGTLLVFLAVFWQSHIKLPVTGHQIGGPGGQTIEILSPSDNIFPDQRPDGRPLDYGFLLIRLPLSDELIIPNDDFLTATYSIDNGPWIQLPELTLDAEQSTTYSGDGALRLLRFKSKYLPRYMRFRILVTLEKRSTGQILARVEQEVCVRACSMGFTQPGQGEGSSVPESEPISDEELSFEQDNPFYQASIAGAATKITGRGVDSSQVCHFDGIRCVGTCGGGKGDDCIIVGRYIGNQDPEEPEPWPLFVCGCSCSGTSNCGEGKCSQEGYICSSGTPGCVCRKDPNYHEPDTHMGDTQIIKHTGDSHTGGDSHNLGSAQIKFCMPIKAFVLAPVTREYISPGQFPGPGIYIKEEVNTEYLKYFTHNILNPYSEIPALGETRPNHRIENIYDFTHLYPTVSNYQFITAFALKKGSTPEECTFGQKVAGTSPVNIRYSINPQTSGYNQHKIWVDHRKNPTTNTRNPNGKVEVEASQYTPDGQYGYSSGRMTDDGYNIMDGSTYIGTTSGAVIIETMRPFGLNRRASEIFESDRRYILFRDAPGVKIGDARALFVQPRLEEPLYSKSSKLQPYVIGTDGTRASCTIHIKTGLLRTSESPAVTERIAKILGNVVCSVGQ